MKIGVDLGGSKIEAVLMSSMGELLERQRVATPTNDYQATLQVIVGLVSQLDAVAGLQCTVGMGTPGSVSLRDGRMKNCNSTCLNGQFLRRDIEALLGRRVAIANDANCFALSESVDGAAAGKQTVFAVILGTGVGGGICINQQLLAGPSAIGSEWGHNLLPGVGVDFDNEQRVCYCGRKNCIETYLSGPGLAKTYFKISGQQRTAKEVAALDLSGDEYASKALKIYQQQLAYALSQVVNLIDPDVIVLGGGVSNIASLYQAVPSSWGDAIFSDSIAVELVAAQYGDSSGVRGAAWLNNSAG